MQTILQNVETFVCCFHINQPFDRQRKLFLRKLIARCCTSTLYLRCESKGNENSNINVQKVENYTD